MPRRARWPPLLPLLQHRTARCASAVASTTTAEALGVADTRAGAVARGTHRAVAAVAAKPAAAGGLDGIQVYERDVRLVVPILAVQEMHAEIDELVKEDAAKKCEGRVCIGYALLVPGALERCVRLDENFDQRDVQHDARRESDGACKEALARQLDLNGTNAGIAERKEAM